MISVVIPTLNAEATLPATLTALVPAVVDGLVREVIIVDGGSSDRTLRIAEQSGARIERTQANRGAQIARGADLAKGPWLLVLHADSELAPGWWRDAHTFIEKVDSGRRRPAAAAFRFALDDDGLAPRLLEWAVNLRSSVLKRPYGDQGLLLPKALYRSLGGLKDLPIMEDLEFVRRLGARRVAILRASAVTSADRYRRDGYVKRTVLNQYCRLLYSLGRSPERIADIYRGASPERTPGAGVPSAASTGHGGKPGNRA